MKFKSVSELHDCGKRKEVRKEKNKNYTAHNYLKKKKKESIDKLKQAFANT